MATSSTIERAAALLKEKDDILIVAHKNPDGDTLGSCFALMYGLHGLGKNARVVCEDGFPDRYAFLYQGYQAEQFEPDLVVAADIADRQLFGDELFYLSNVTDLCIDHHPSNTFYAKETLLRPTAAATAEIITDLLDALEVQITPLIAACLYTGLSTDTGCFRFSNTTAKTMFTAARLIQLGAPNADINYNMFCRKTKSRIAVEREVLSGMEFHNEGRCAVICMPRALLKSVGADEAELDGVASIPVQIEGVEIGVTLREKEGGYKISLRTNHYMNASDICAELGGGGHARASGCFLAGTLENAKKQILDLIGIAFSKLDDGQ